MQGQALGAALTFGHMCSPGGNRSVMQACGNTVHLTCGLKRKKKARTGRQPFLAMKSPEEVFCDARCCRGRQGAMGMVCRLTFLGAGQTCLCPWT